MYTGMGLGRFEGQNPFLKTKPKDGRFLQKGLKKNMKSFVQNLYSSEFSRPTTLWTTVARWKLVGVRFLCDRGAQSRAISDSAAPLSLASP